MTAVLRFATDILQDISQLLAVRIAVHEEVSCSGSDCVGFGGLSGGGRGGREFPLLGELSGVGGSLHSPHLIKRNRMHGRLNRGRLNWGN